MFVPLAQARNELEVLAALDHAAGPEMMALLGKTQFYSILSSISTRMSAPSAQAKNEVELLAALDHPNIVQYYECYVGANQVGRSLEMASPVESWVTSSTANKQRNRTSCAAAHGSISSRLTKRAESAPKLSVCCARRG